MQESEKPKKEYLKDRQYYIDRYDLSTINTCLTVLKVFKETYQEMLTSPDGKNISVDEKTRTVNYLYNQKIYSLTADRYEKKEQTINKWINEDQEKQDKYDQNPPTNINCSNCNISMECTFKELLDFRAEPHRMVYFFDCKNCKSRKAIYENGDEYKSEPQLCPKCKKTTKTSIKIKGEVSTYITKCTSCDYIDVDISDHSEWKKEYELKQKEDTELLAKHREKFCLSDTEGKERLDILAQMEYANEVYEVEKRKFKHPAYTQVDNIKTLSITELETLLTPTLEKGSFIKLTFDKPEIGPQIVMHFTLQEGKSDRKDNDSTSALEKLLKTALKDSNWRLMSTGVRYQLGFLTGDLKGYSSKEDILKLAGKPDEIKQKELDPEKESKYGSSRFIGLAKMTAKFDAEEEQRKEHLKTEPDGFIFKPNGGKGYSCNLCYHSMAGNEAWWNLDGLVCLNCHKNIVDKVIPGYIIHETNTWFSDTDFDSVFGIHNSTGRKFARQGLLQGRHLKDENDKTYLTVFLNEENQEFIKGHPRIGERKKDMFFFDKYGNKVWL